MTEGRATLMCLVILAAAVHTAISFDSARNLEIDSFNARWFSDESKRSLRALDQDTYSMTKYTESDTSITINDCDRNRLNVYSVSFAALKADDDTEYLGHIFTTANMGCLSVTLTTTQNVNLKECLEWADAFLDSNSTGNSFMHDSTDSSCAVFTGWRKHKFRQCTRDTVEKIVYLRIYEPFGFNACTDVAVVVASLDYTTTGNPIATFTVTNDCSCEISSATIEYLGTTYDLTTLDPYTYTYPLADTGYQNLTNIRIYEGFTEVASLFNVIPENYF